MNYVSITAASERPVSLTGFKRHINFAIDDTSKDEHFGFLLDMATDEAQRFTGRQFMPAIFELQLNDFTQAVEIDRLPVSGVNSVQYFDASNEAQSLVSGTDYYVDLAAEPVVVHFINTYAVYPYRADAVKIRFGAGYTSENDVPASIRGAILFAATDYYLNPGDNVRNLPVKSRALLRNYRVYGSA